MERMELGLRALRVALACLRWLRWWSWAFRAAPPLEPIEPRQLSAWRSAESHLGVPQSHFAAMPAPQEQPHEPPCQSRRSRAPAAKFRRAASAPWQSWQSRKKVLAPIGYFHLNNKGLHVSSFM